MKLRNLTRERVEQKLAHDLRNWRRKFGEARDNGSLWWEHLYMCSHRLWLGRTNGRYEVLPPFQWSEYRVPFASDSRVGVVIHVYYVDLVDELIAHLKTIPAPFDVYVTNASGQKLDEDRFKVGRAENAVVLPVKNHGRDILPLIELINSGYLDQYELILKLHTKKSLWREEHQTLSGSGEQWRESLLSSLVGSETSVRDILSQFANDPDLGALGAPDTLLGPEYWGGDRSLVDELGSRLGLEFPKESLQFISGSMYWIRGFLLQGLRALSLSGLDFESELGQVDGTTAHAVERLIGLLTVEAGLKNDELPTPRQDSSAWEYYLPSAERVPNTRFIPFYLPQFHPSEVNDKHWGKGFTEWTNVTRGRPIYPGHVQPLLPGELGFYDLRNDEVRQRQTELAEYAGIAGFMYYYYWFSGKRVLNLPIEKLLKQQDLDQPFCIMWANENWTRTWDGQEQNIILGQRYDDVPAEDFIDDVIEFLLDPRYIRIDGKAVLAVYRPAQMGNFSQVAAVWRERARAAGVGELLILSVDVTKDFDGIEGDLAAHNLDGHLAFPPHGVVWPRTKRSEVRPHHRFTGHLISYRRMAEAATIMAEATDPTGYPGVMVNFDNTARKHFNADIWYGSNPYTFHRWLKNVSEAIAHRPLDQRVVFINAWNEWAESAVLEPTERWGNTYLQAVRNVAFS